MGILQRTGDIFAANVNDLVDRFEQPEKMLRHALGELEESTVSVQTAVARSIAARRLLEKQRDEHAREVDLWQRRAAAAVVRDDDLQARRAIANRLDAERRVAGDEQRLKEARRTNEMLVDRLSTLRAAHVEGRRRLAAWHAQEAMAAVERRWCDVAGGDRYNIILTRIERWSERLDLAEAEAIAFSELSVTTGESASCDFAQREREEALDAELTRLKSARPE